MLEENKLHEDIPMEDYLAEDAIGSSTLNYIVPPYTPADFQANSVNSYFKGSSAAHLGTFIHSAVLEPDTFNDLYVYEPEKFDKRTKAGKAQAVKFAEEAENKIVIPYQDKEKIDAAVKAVDAHDELSDILSDGRAEVTGVATFVKHLREGGLRFKSREDWLCNDGMIYDIKTLSVNPSDDNLAKTIANWNYHFKAVHHMEVMRRCGVDVKGFAWIFITTHLPICHVVVKHMGPQMEEVAKDMWVKATALLARCQNKNEWPGFDKSIENIELPAWAVPKIKTPWGELKKGEL